MKLSDLQQGREMKFEVAWPILTLQSGWWNKAIACTSYTTITASTSYPYHAEVTDDTVAATDGKDEFDYENE